MAGRLFGLLSVFAAKSVENIEIDFQYFTRGMHILFVFEISENGPKQPVVLHPKVLHPERCQPNHRHHHHHHLVVVNVIDEPSFHLLHVVGWRCGWIHQVSRPLSALAANTVENIEIEFQHFIREMHILFVFDISENGPEQAVVLHPKVLPPPPSKIFSRGGVWVLSFRTMVCR